MDVTFYLLILISILVCFPFDKKDRVRDVREKELDQFQKIMYSYLPTLTQSLLIVSMIVIRSLLKSLGRE